MKRFFPALAVALAGCAASAPHQAVDSRFSYKPANAFEEAAASMEGVRPILFGGWLKTVTPGSGGSPNPDSVVRVHYQGALTDGTVFDSSYQRGEPAMFSLRNVVRCWTFGVPMMKVGEKARLVCPAVAAYGKAGSPPAIPGDATLVFEIELLSIVK